MSAKPAALNADMPSTVDDPDDPRMDLAWAVYDELWRLTDAQWEVYYWRFEEGMSIREVAMKLHCSIGAARTHLQRIKDRLRPHLAWLVRKNQNGL